MINCTNNTFTDILVDMKCIIPYNVFLLCLALIKQSSSFGIFCVPEVTHAEWVVVKVISLIPGISPGIDPGLSNQSFVNSKQYTPEKVGFLGFVNDINNTLIFIKIPPYLVSQEQCVHANHF